MQTLMIVPHAIDGQQHQDLDVPRGAYLGPCALTSQARPHNVGLVEDRVKRCPTCGRLFEMHREGSAYVVSLVQ